MDSQNIKDLILQLKIMSNNIHKIAENDNNPLTVWIPILTTLFMGFIAILMGIIAIFQDKIESYFCKPKIEINHIESPIYKRYSRNISRYNFVFEIKNTGKSTLEDAEALVTEISKLNGEKEEKIGNLSFNLAWRDKGGTTIGKIPLNTHKYFDFGNIKKPKNSDLIEFEFSALLLRKEIKPLKSGEYKIKIEFSANNVKPQIKIYKLVIKNEWADEVKNIKRMILIEEINYKVIK